MNYIFFFLISKLFGAQEVGYFALSFTVIQLLAIITRSGLDIGIFKEISFSEYSISNLKGIRNTSVFYILTSSLILLGALSLINNFNPTLIFATVSTGNYVSLFLLSLPFYAVMFFNGEIHRAKKGFALYVFYQNFGVYLLLVLFLIIRYFIWEWSFDELVWIFVFSLMGLSFLSFWGTGSLGSKIENKTQLRFGEHLKNSIPIGISSLGFFLMSWLDGVVLAQYYPEDVVGKYAIAYRIALLGSFALVSINSAIGPRITELHALNKSDEMIMEVRKTTKIGFWATIPIALITLAFPKSILGLFGQEFESAYLAMLVILLGQVINTVFGPTGIVLQLSGHQKVFRNIILISAFLNIVLNYLIIPKYGILGAAAVNTFSIALWKIWSTIIIKRIYGKTFLYIPLIPPK